MAKDLGEITGKRPLSKRPLFSRSEAGELADLFRILANDTRLRLLHELERGGEVSVSELAAAIGMSPQAVSNQLQRLADKRIVAARRDRTRIYYRVIDPCVNGLLELGICLAEETASIGAPTVKVRSPGEGKGGSAP
jgi:ArsR family transcriptional regulator, lead/cadmium/zinc/bismuth-responsive transcriptional repressor